MQGEYQTIRIPTMCIPEGARLIEAYDTGTHIIVCGDPPAEPENLTEAEYDKWLETAHNCDWMGCGSLSHVLYRFDKNTCTRIEGVAAGEPVADYDQFAKRLVGNAIKRRVGDGSVISKPWELIDDIADALRDAVKFARQSERERIVGILRTWRNLYGIDNDKLRDAIAAEGEEKDASRIV